MPSIKGISFTDGIKIDSVDAIKSVEIKAVDFPDVSLSATPEGDLEVDLTQQLQSNFEVSILLSTIPKEDPVKQEPPQLLVNERIQDVSGQDYLIATTMWVAVHVFSTTPLRYTVMCQNASEGPITGNWWL